MTRIERPRSSRIHRAGDHLPGASHLYIEPSLPENLSLPVLEPHAWDNAEQELEQILAWHGESPHVGNRFLVGQLIRHLSDQTIYYDYIMTREVMGWTRQLSTWSRDSPYEYDFDVFEMRPISQCIGISE
jgi:hypothetical protein